MKQRPKKVSNQLKVLGVVGIIALVFMAILWIPKVKETLAEAFKTTAENMAYVSRIGLGTTVGVIVILSGVAALVVPIVGITLILVGLAMAIYSLWPLFYNSAASVLPEKK